MNAPRHEIAAFQMDEREVMSVLQNSFYPGAKPESVKLVLSYCRASGLDPMLKPVHIVPMDVATGEKDGRGYPIKEKRDVIMPGVGMYRTQASETQRYAGITEPEWGPMLTWKYQTEVWFDGPNGKRQKRTDNAELQYPEWCRITVFKIVDGMKCSFTAVEYWLENAAMKNDGAPNSMWAKRIRGQLAKCTEAQALRKAFPDKCGAQPTAEEMEGRSSYDEDGVIDNMPASKPEVQQPRSRTDKEQQPALENQPTETLPASMPTDREAEPVDAKPASASAIRLVKKKMENAGIDEAKLREKFGHGVDDITAASINDVLAWVANPA